MRFFIAIGLASVATVLAQGRSRCIDPSVPAELKNNVTSEVLEMRGTYGQPKSFTVDTYVHVITTKAAKKKYPRAQIDRQMGVLNKVFKQRRFQFKLKGVHYTVNETWARDKPNDAYNGLVYGPEYMKKLRKGSYRTLNLYLVSDLEEIFGGAELPLPAPTAYQKVIDGVVVWAETMPGGNATTSDGPYNLGFTVVHEVGHFLGLLHTFSEPEDPNAEPSCDDRGDFVSDTPAELTPTRGCPKGKDTCPNKRGKDPIENYMDYSTDNCYTEFTPGQTRRMVYSYAQYRAGK